MKKEKKIKKRKRKKKEKENGKILQKTENHKKRSLKHTKNCVMSNLQNKKTTSTGYYYIINTSKITRTNIEEVNSKVYTKKMGFVY